MVGPEPYLNQSGHPVDVVGLPGVRPPVDVQSGDGEGASRFRHILFSNKLRVRCVYFFGVLRNVSQFGQLSKLSYCWLG